MLNSKWGLGLFGVICLLDATWGLYFHIGETERKCFIEEIPDETNVIVHYKVQLYDPRTGGFMPSSTGIGMHVDVRDPDDSVILSRIYSSEGKISFTSHSPGEHVICMSSNSSAWFGGSQLRVHLDIQIGEHAINYGEVVQKEKLSELQLRIRQLLDQVDQITKEQNYQRSLGGHSTGTSPPLLLTQKCSQYPFDRELAGHPVYCDENKILFGSFVKTASDRLVRAQTHEFYGGQ